MYRIIKVDLRTGEQLRWPSPVAANRFDTESIALAYMRDMAGLNPESQWVDESTLSLMTEGAPWKYTVAVADEPAQVPPRAIRFPKDVLERLKETARERKVSVNSLVVEAVRVALQPKLKLED